MSITNSGYYLFVEFWKLYEWDNALQIIFSYYLLLLLLF